MGRYVTQKELKNAMEAINKAIFGLDVAIQVLAEHYCMVDEKEFKKFVLDCANFRIKQSNDSNDLTKEKTTEE